MEKVNVGKMAETYKHLGPENQAKVRQSLETREVAINVQGLRPKLDKETLTILLPVFQGPIFNEAYVDHLQKLEMSPRKIDQLLDDAADHLSREEVAAIVVARMK